jgi:hypothetical protein
MARHTVGLGRQIQAQAGESLIGIHQTEAGPGSTFVRQLGLGKHSVFLQVRQLRFQQFAGHGQQYTVTLQHDPEARLHAPLLGAARAEAGVGVVEVIEVAGQLPLEELGRVSAANGQDTFVGQGAEESRVSHGSSQLESHECIIEGRPANG